MTAALFACAAAAAAAEPVETTFAATVNAISGDHEISGGEKARTSFAPLPLGELTFRHGSDSLRIEALPAVTLPVFQGSRVGLPDGLTAADAESAAQVDASARIAHRVGKHG